MLNSWTYQTTQANNKITSELTKMMHGQAIG